MVNQFSRTQLLLGKEGMERLFHARVAVFGTELRKRGVKSLKVVYSKEPVLTPLDDMTISCRTHCVCPPGTARKCTQRRQAPGRDHLHLRGRRVQQPRCQRRRPGVPAHRQAHHLYGAGARLCGH